MLWNVRVVKKLLHRCSVAALANDILHVVHRAKAVSLTGIAWLTYTRMAWFCASVVPHTKCSSSIRKQRSEEVQSAGMTAGRVRPRSHVHCENVSSLAGSVNGSVCCPAVVNATKTTGDIGGRFDRHSQLCISNDNNSSLLPSDGSDTSSAAGSCQTYVFNHFTEF